jgi:hypothetical protein
MMLVSAGRVADQDRAHDNHKVFAASNPPLHSVEMPLFRTTTTQRRCSTFPTVDYGKTTPVIIQDPPTYFGSQFLDTNNKY